MVLFTGYEHRVNELHCLVGGYPMKKTSDKFLSAALSIVLAIGLMPLPAYAAETSGGGVVS